MSDKQIIPDVSVSEIQTAAHPRTGSGSSVCIGIKGVVDNFTVSSGKNSSTKSSLPVYRTCGDNIPADNIIDNLTFGMRADSTAITISVTVKSSGNGNIRFNEIIINFNVVTVRTNKNTTALSAVIISCNVSGNIVVSNGTCTVGVTINTPTIVFVMVSGKII